MPDLDWGAYLLDYLFEFGPVKADDALDPPFILAMQEVLGVKFKPWESRLLIRLSREYKAEMHAATRRDAPPPYEPAAKQWRYVQDKDSIRNLNSFLK